MSFDSKKNSNPLPRSIKFYPSSLVQAVAVAFAASVGTLHAEEQTPEFHLGEIVITGQAPGVEKITTVRTVTSEEIQLRGARTLNEAIALLPGVALRTGGDGIPRIQVRGMETRHVKLLLDGIPVNSTLDGNFDPTQIPVEQIARIKLSAGSSSMLYGDGDLGGAINIITRKGAGDLHVSGAGIEVGQDQQNRVWTSLSGASGPMDYFISASRQDRDSFKLSGDYQATSLQSGGQRINSDLSRTNFYGNLGYAASTDWLFGLTAKHTEGSYGLPPSTFNTSTDAFATKAKFERIDNLRADSTQFNAEYAPDAPWSGRGWLYYNANAYDDNNYDDAGFSSVSNPKLSNTFLLHNETRTAGGHIQASYKTSNLGSMTVGLDNRNESWSDRGLVHNVSTGGGNFAARNISDKREVDVQSAAFEYTVTPFNRTDVTAGYSTYRQRRDDGSTQSADGFLLGIAHAFTDATSLRAAVSQHVRFPTIQQLYDAVSGDATLKRELARNNEIGVTHSLAAGTNVSATLFSNDVYNYIEKDNFSNLYRNYDHYRFSGAEFSGDTMVGNNLRLRVGYTYLEAENLSAGTVFSELQYRPRNQASVEASYDFGAGLKADVSILTVADQYYYSRTTPIQQAQLGNYELVNFKVSKRLFEKGGSIYLGANNLFDRNYQTSYGLPQAGRFIYAGLKYGL